MTSPLLFRQAIDRSGRNHDDFEEFKVMKGQENLVCKAAQTVIMWDYMDTQGEFEKPLTMTDAQCYERCMSDKKCNQVASPFLKKGFEFKAG